MHPISILIADDDAMIRQCLRRAIETDPCLSVQWEACNGLEALHLAQKFHPDVILMDAQMPRMDGLEATRCLRQQDRDICVLVMSVYEQVRAQALAAGADEFVTKDCGCATIRETIRRFRSPQSAMTGSRSEGDGVRL